MVTRHPKSPCCGGPVHRHGQRRFQCATCGRTWRVRLKRRGRKAHRVSTSVLRQALDENRSLAEQARARSLSPSAIRYRFGRALTACLHGPPVQVPERGDLILLGDGLWLRYQGQIWVLYLLALKPVTESRAFFLDPVLQPNPESPAGWQATLGTIPSSLLLRVRALVSDGFRGAKGLVRTHGWIHQRCHFHLLAQLHARRGRNKALSGRPIRAAIVQRIREALVSPSLLRLEELRGDLRQFAQDAACPRHFTTFVRSFLRDLSAFRAYRQYPTMHLPTTTNTIESMVNLLRPRLRPLNSPHAALRWATGFIRRRQWLTCNGVDFPPN